MPLQCEHILRYMALEKGWIPWVGADFFDLGQYANN